MFNKTDMLRCSDETSVYDIGYFVVIVIVFVITFFVAIVAQTFPHLTIVAFVLFHERG